MLIFFSWYLPGRILGNSPGGCLLPSSIYTEMNRRMDSSHKASNHMTHYRTLATPNLADFSLSVTSLEDKPIGTLVSFVHRHAQNAPFE